MGASVSATTQGPVLLRRGEFDESYVFIDEADLLPAVKIDLSHLTASDVKTIRRVLEKQQRFETQIREEEAERLSRIYVVPAVRNVSKTLGWLAVRRQITWTFGLAFNDQARRVVKPHRDHANDEKLSACSKCGQIQHCEPYLVGRSGECNKVSVSLCCVCQLRCRSGAWFHGSDSEAALRWCDTLMNQLKSFPEDTAHKSGKTSSQLRKCLLPERFTNNNGHLLRSVNRPYEEPFIDTAEDVDISSYICITQAGEESKSQGQIKVHLSYDRPNHIVRLGADKVCEANPSTHDSQHLQARLLQACLLPAKNEGLSCQSARSCSNRYGEVVFDRLFIWDNLSPAEIQGSRVELSVWTLYPAITLIGVVSLPLGSPDVSSGAPQLLCVNLMKKIRSADDTQVHQIPSQSPLSSGDDEIVLNESCNGPMLTSLLVEALVSSIKRRPRILSQRSGKSSEDDVMLLTMQTSVEAEDVVNKCPKKQKWQLVISSEQNSAEEEDETPTVFDMTLPSSQSYISPFTTFTSIQRVLPRDSRAFSFCEDEASPVNDTEAHGDAEGEEHVRSHSTSELIGKHPAVSTQVRRKSQALRHVPSWLNSDVLADLQDLVRAPPRRSNVSSVRLRKRKSSKIYHNHPVDCLDKEMNSRSETSEEEDSELLFPRMQIRRTSSEPYLSEVFDRKLSNGISGRIELSMAVSDNQLAVMVGQASGLHPVESDALPPSDVYCKAYLTPPGLRRLKRKTLPVPFASYLILNHTLVFAAKPEGSELQVMLWSSHGLVSRHLMLCSVTLRLTDDLTEYQQPRWFQLTAPSPADSSSGTLDKPRFFPKSPYNLRKLKSSLALF